MTTSIKFETNKHEIKNTSKAKGCINVEVSLGGVNVPIKEFLQYGLGREGLWGLYSKSEDFVFLTFSFKSLVVGDNELKLTGPRTVSLQKNGWEFAQGEGMLTLTEYVEAKAVVGSFKFKQQVSGKVYDVVGDINITA